MQTASIMKQAEIRWNQVKEAKANGQNLTELPFINAQPVIIQLVQQLSTQEIQIAELEQHYRAKHPKMIEAENQLVLGRTAAATALVAVYKAVGGTWPVK